MTEFLNNEGRNMLTRLYVRNYRSIEEIELRLSPLTVLVGPNGAGKSNIIDALRFVRDALTIGLENAILNRGGINTLRRWSPKGRPYDIHIELDFTVGGQKATYAFTLGAYHRKDYRVKLERYVEEREQGKFFVYEIREGRWIQAPSSESPQEQELVGAIESSEPQFNLVLPLISKFFSILVGEWFSGVGLYTIYPELFRNPQKSLNTFPLEEKIQNLASVLKGLRKNYSHSFEALVEVLAAVVPGVSDVSVVQAGGYLVTRLHYKDGPVFPLSQESDGTLRLLAMLTALYQYPPLSFVVIEEPELNIHPGALSVLRDVFLEVSERFQLLITTHSPDLLFDLPADALRVVEKVNSVTLVGEIAEVQRQAIAEKLFFPGELMRIEGLRRA